MRKLFWYGGAVLMVWAVGVYWAASWAERHPQEPMAECARIPWQLLTDWNPIVQVGKAMGAKSLALFQAPKPPPAPKAAPACPADPGVACPPPIVDVIDISTAENMTLPQRGDHNSPEFAPSWEDTGLARELAQKSQWQFGEWEVETVLPGEIEEAEPAVPSVMPPADDDAPAASADEKMERLNSLIHQAVPTAKVKVHSEAGNVLILSGSVAGLVEADTILRIIRSFTAGSSCGADIINDLRVDLDEPTAHPAVKPAKIEALVDIFKDSDEVTEKDAETLPMPAAENADEEDAEPAQAEATEEIPMPSEDQQIKWDEIEIIEPFAQLGQPSPEQFGQIMSDEAMHRLALQAAGVRIIINEEEEFLQTGADVYGLYAGESSESEQEPELLPMPSEEQDVAAEEAEAMPSDNTSDCQEVPNIEQRCPVCPASGCPRQR
jgi:hypothetical protein